MKNIIFPQEKTNKLGIPDDNYPDDIVFIKRIEKICKNPLISSRFIGDDEEPMIIMAFLPMNDIDLITKTTIKLLKKYKVIPNYEIIGINSKITNNPKQSIENARIVAKNYKKKGVLVLSGRQCSLGVSIHNCDIVILLNNNSSFDMIYQMMFRCMTEGKNKKCGFIIDLNIHRVIETSIDYAALIKPNEHPKDATKYILQEKLICLNGDHWLPCFGKDISQINNISNSIYNIYSSNTEKALNYFLNKLRFKEIILNNKEQQIFNAIFNNIKPSKLQNKIIKELINDGIEKKIFNENIIKKKLINDKKNIKYMDILKHIIPLICLLTIHNQKSSFIEMYNFIEKNKYIYDIFIDQTKSWWGKNIDSKIFKIFINIYKKYILNDKETNQIIRTIKELFIKNINNNKELSKLIDKYLIPQELEKKKC